MNMVDILDDYREKKIPEKYLDAVINSWTKEESVKNFKSLIKSFLNLQEIQEQDRQSAERFYNELQELKKAENKK